MPFSYVFFPKVVFLSSIELNFHAAVIQGVRHESSSFTPSSYPVRVGLNCSLRLPAYYSELCWDNLDINIVWQNCVFVVSWTYLYLVFSTGLSSVSTQVFELYHLTLKMTWMSALFILVNISLLSLMYNITGYAFTEYPTLIVVLEYA